MEPAADFFSTTYAQINAISTGEQETKKYKRLNFRRMNMFINMLHPSVYHYNMTDAGFLFRDHREMT